MKKVLQRRMASADGTLAERVCRAVDDAAPKRGILFMATNFSKELIVKPGHKVKLAKFDPGDTLGWDKGHAMKAQPREDAREAR